MECPECGYILTPFDKKCARCEAFQGKSRKNPYVAHQERQEVARAIAKPPPVLPPEPAPQLAEAAPAAPPVPQLSEDMLACIVCGNLNVQNVPAIVQSGTWTQKSRGQMVGGGMDGAGHMVPVGGSTSSTSRGATQLAQMLMPPATPRLHKSFMTTWALTFIGLVVFLVAASSSATAGIVAAAIALSLSSVSLAYEISLNTKGRMVYQEQMENWTLAVGIWNRLFFCPRCNHVYDPVTKRGAAANDMMSLL